MPSGSQAQWCPWCGTALPAEGVTDHCPACGSKVAEGTALESAPEPSIRPEDPEASIPARGPSGASPLPEGTPDPTVTGMARFAALVAGAVFLLAVLAYFVGGPALDRVPQPESSATARSTTAPSDTPASPRPTTAR